MAVWQGPRRVLAGLARRGPPRVRRLHARLRGTRIQLARPRDATAGPRGQRAGNLARRAPAAGRSSRLHLPQPRRPRRQEGPAAARPAEGAQAGSGGLARLRLQGRVPRHAAHWLASRRMAGSAALPRLAVAGCAHPGRERPKPARHQRRLSRPRGKPAGTAAPSDVLREQADRHRPDRRRKERRPRPAWPPAHPQRCHRRERVRAYSAGATPSIFFRRVRRNRSSARYTTGVV